MADNCCNPVTPETCVHKCPQEIDSCCVKNEDELSCIIPPIILTTTVTAGTYTIPNVAFTPDSIIVPNPFYGVITVSSETSNVIEEGTTVVKIVGSTIYVDKPILSTNGQVDIIFTFTEQRQCDINAAINDLLCNPPGPGLCQNYTSIPYASAQEQGIQWSTYPGALPLEISSASQCIVRLRGLIKGNVVLYSDCGEIVSLVGTIANPALRPLQRKVLSVTVITNNYNANFPYANKYMDIFVYNTGDYVTHNSITYVCNTDGTTGTFNITLWDEVDTPPVELCSHYYPGYILIEPTLSLNPGDVSVVFSIDIPRQNIPIDGAIITVSFDGLTYEIHS